jgi:hypothetical protein
MGKLSLYALLIGALLLAMVTATAVPAACSLTATQFGFPIIVQSGQSTMFSSDSAAAFDLESINIDFPMFDGLMDSSGAPSAVSGPTIGQFSAFSGMGSLFDMPVFGFH